MKFNLRARLTAEFLDSAFLVAAVIGSGIMGERLAGGNVAIALLANTIATGAALVALILTFGPISGAHLNPAITLADAVEHGIPWSEAVAYMLVRCGGRNCGSGYCASDVRAALVHVVFTLPTRVVAGSKRVRGNVRIVVRHLGMFAITLGSGSVRGCGLHHRRILVHCVNLVCKPCSNNRPFLV
jgi:glycerol uptake facilitator-like aquaporin